VLKIFVGYSIFTGNIKMDFGEGNWARMWSGFIWLRTFAIASILRTQ
jgi:hypothetical protein